MNLHEISVQMFPVFGICENYFFTPTTEQLETKRNLLRAVTVGVTVVIAISK